MADLFAPLRNLAEKLRRAPIDQELAISEDSLFRKFNLYPYSPDRLIARKGFDIYEEMLRDDQIAQAVATRKTLMLSAGWRLEPASQDAKDLEVADFVDWTLRNEVEGSFEADLWEIAGAAELGWSIGEKVWRVIETGPHKGRIALGAYKSKNPRDFNIDRDEFDNIKPDGVIRITAPQLGQRLPADKFVIYSYRRRYEDVFGTSILRALYDLWWLKHVLKRAWGVSFERAGVPVAVAKYPAGMKEADQNKLFKLVKSIRFESAAILPKDVELNFVEAQRQGKDAMLEAIKHIDGQIAKTILGQTLTQEQGERGSQALGAVHQNILGLYVAEFGRDLAIKAVDAQIVRDLVDFNFPGVTAYPRFTFNPPMREEQAPRVNAFLAAVTAGTVRPTLKDEAEIRKALGFPERADDDPTLSAPRAATTEPRVPNEDGPDTPPTAPDLRPGPARREALAERLFTGVRRRTLTGPEKRVDFAEVLRTIEESGVEDMMADLAGLLREAEEDLLAQVQRKKLLENADAKGLETLAIRNLGDLRAAIARGMTRVARRGSRDARRELAAARREAKMAEPFDVARFLPEEVEKLFAARAFQMAGVLRDQVLGLAKDSLFKSIRNGQDFRAAAEGLRKALEPYVAAGVVDPAAASGPRLETVVRTNIVDAYNTARREEFMRDTDFVVGLQYSAILDDRVRPSHAAMDERQYLTTSKVWDDWTPPNGFNCRCVLIPVTRADGDFEESDPPPAGVEPDAGFGAAGA